MDLKRFFRPLIFAACVLTLGSIAHAQNLGDVGLTNSNQKVLNAVTAAGTSAVITNLGQDFHILCYETTGNVTFQMRLEFSFTGNTNDFFALSDDATSQTAGCVYGQGTYPYLRANLLSFVGTGTMTAYYTGNFSGSMPTTGSLNQSQQYKKIVASSVTGTGSQQIYNVNPPCANTNGTMFVTYSAPASGGVFSIFPGVDSGTLFSAAAFGGTLQAVGTPQTFQIGSQAATFIQISVTAPGASVYSIQYIFNCPATGAGTSGPQVTGILQPMGTSSFNLEAVSLTNGAVTTGPTVGNGQRGAIFSVNARCSAGTAQLTVSDNGVVIWSSGPTEVGTTTFRYQWNPGLAGSIGKSFGASLSACGAGNIGTLDIQASAE